MRVWWALTLLVLAGAGPASAQGMLSSKHNLSVSGPGPVKATSETQVCVFCHTPHNASPAAPLWNRDLPGSNYTPYASGTLQSAVGQPNGYTRLCLSCHDGTVAIGSVHNLGGQPATVQMQGTGAGGAMPAGGTLLGINLTNDHPVSFVFNAALAAADGELVSPTALTGAIRLYEGATPGVRDSVQCTSCHDPHLTANPKFLKKPVQGRPDNLCLTCHAKPGWPSSSHESATTKFVQGTPVADLSCAACHHPHTKPGAPHLLRNGVTDAGAAAIQLTCFQCHAPTGEGGISFDVKSQVAKATKHPVGQFTGHQPVFTVATPAAEPALNASRHVECPDCHNPHRVTATDKFSGMRGIDLGGNPVEDVTQPRSIAEYEICFRCHAETYPSVVGATMAGDPTGTVPTSNKRTEFQTANSSFHPVAGAGKNTSSNLNAQLAPNGLSTSSVIRCTDCHNNDFFSGSAFRGVVSQYPSNQLQPKGPHGSARANLLRARAWNVLPGPSSWSSTNFDLCFQCHDVTALTGRRTGDGARTNFYDQAGGKDNLHWVHLIDRVDKSRPTCKSCHYNVHSNAEAQNTQYRVTTGACSTGSIFTMPNAVPLTTTRLINFHPNIRPFGGRARPEWCFNTVTRERRCYLACHQTNGAPGGVTMNGDDKHRYTPPASGDIK